MRKFRFEIPFIVQSDSWEKLAPTKDLLGYVCDKFNEDAGYLVQIGKEYAPTLSRLTMLGVGSKCYIKAETSKDADDSVRNKIVDYVDGQLSDGWGEGFEQQPIEARQFGLSVDIVYVSLWERGFRGNDTQRQRKKFGKE